MTRALLGALLGVVLGVGCLVVVAIPLHVDSFWPVLLLGVICGASMRALTARQGSPYVRSALAAAAVLVATIGGRLAVAAIVQNAVPVQDVAEIIDIDNTAATMAERNPGQSADGTPPTSHNARVARREPAGLLDSPRRGAYSFLDGIWLSIGALIAYELARGRQGNSRGASPVEDAASRPTEAEA